MNNGVKIFISEIEWLAVLKCDELVNIIGTLHHGTKVFSKSVRQTSARFTDVKFATFTARNAVNDVGGSACKIVPKTKLDLGPEIDVAELRNEHV